MSESNGSGVFRIQHKGREKFAFGYGTDTADDVVFELDVVTAMQEWFIRDDSFRDKDGPNEGKIPEGRIHEYHQACISYVKELAKSDRLDLSVADAMDFLARLRERYDALADFFRPKKPTKAGSQDSSAEGLEFSEEPAPPQQPSTS